MVYSSRETKVPSGYLNVMICSNIAIHVVLQCASMYCSDYFFYVILERFMRRTSSFNCMLASEKHINRRTVVLSPKNAGVSMGSCLEDRERGN